MKYGLMIFPTEAAISPADLAVAAEERRFESLWVAEHSHIPVSRETPWPGGGELPRMYCETMDPFVALAAAAAVTKTLKLATGICLVVQRDPIHTAKQVASLDQLSGGRFLFGVGGGWNVEEMRNHGTDAGHRFKLLRERIEAMKAIWTEEAAEYHGELVDFDPIHAWPKPIQKPHPPIHVGGEFPGGARRAVRYGDGWIPILGRGSDEMAKNFRAFREMAREAGRDPESLEISIYGCPADPDKLRELQDMGVQRAVFPLPPQAGEEILKRLDSFAELATRVR